MRVRRLDPKSTNIDKWSVGRNNVMFSQSCVPKNGVTSHVTSGVELGGVCNVTVALQWQKNWWENVGLELVLRVA